MWSSKELTPRRKEAKIFFFLCSLAAWHEIRFLRFLANGETPRNSEMILSASLKTLSLCNHLFLFLPEK